MLYVTICTLIHPVAQSLYDSMKKMTKLWDLYYKYYYSYLTIV
jgi:hypothetical protein